MQVVFRGRDLPATMAGVFGMLMGSGSTTGSLTNLSEGGWKLLSGRLLGCSFSGKVTVSGHVAGADTFDVVLTLGVLFVTMAVDEGNGDLAISSNTR
ncbi:hypothetical protein PoB_005948100 [Plakobranchus ocellatus]|uniref:Uncharacterized protein n=1 Tax=Plakobranchus ocellatus TaxID=259542 RepID=A0AAV4CJB0_9GAST|nr:hypothetical protein PoB_005948100 [Plakobranchus ocellatus]